MISPDFAPVPRFSSHAIEEGMASDGVMQWTSFLPFFPKILHRQLLGARTNRGCLEMSSQKGERRTLVPRPLFLLFSLPSS